MSDFDKLKQLIEIQCTSGNWDYDPYMHGMANGMICCLAVLENKEPRYLIAPDQWLKDSKISNEPISTLHD